MPGHILLYKRGAIRRETWLYTVSMRRWITVYVTSSPPLLSTSQSVLIPCLAKTLVSLSPAINQIKAKKSTMLHGQAPPAASGNRISHRDFSNYKASDQQTLPSLKRPNHNDHYLLYSFLFFVEIFFFFGNNSRADRQTWDGMNILRPSIQNISCHPETPRSMLLFSLQLSWLANTF